MRRWSEEVQNIAFMVTDNYDDENLRSTFTKLAMQLHLEQPLKTPFVAAVLLVANTRKSELLGEFLTTLAQSIESKIALGEWRDVKLHLKLLACLQSTLEGDGLFPLLDELFNRAADLQTASSDDVSCGRVQTKRSIANDIPDYWNRISEDHPAYYPIHHGVVGAGSIPPEGC